MSAATQSLKADRDALIEICNVLEDADWKAPSGCVGWSVKDVVAHMGALFWLVVDPSTLPPVEGLPAERAQDVYVQSRGDWSADRVLEDYHAVSAQALDALDGLKDQSFEVPLGDVGTYPASFLANAFAFDHYTHIRADLFRPRGPLDSVAPPSDEMRLVPTLDWIEAALPQQNPALVDRLEDAVEIELTGTAPRTIQVGTGKPAARITSDSAAFVLWITHRGDWDDLGVLATGDKSVLSTVRQLKVF